MALQPLPRMRMARPRMGGTLGQIAPVDLNSPSNVNASADNDAAAQRQQAWNQAAADQYSQMRQGQNQLNVPAIDNDTNRRLLAKAMGYDPNNSPTMGQLHAKFISLPPDVQAGMHQKFNFPFLNDDDSTGEDLIKNSAAQVQKHVDSALGTAVDAFSKGDLGFDGTTTDANGNKTPTNWYVMRSLPNPNDPTGTAGLPPVRVKQPANPAIVQLMQMAINKGYYPDPITGKLASSNNPPTPSDRMSEDQFQQVLNARGQSDDTDKFQQVLNQRAGITNPTGQQAQVAQFPSQYNQPSAPLGDSTTLPSQLTPASTAALAARSSLLGKLGSTSGFTDALDQDDPNSLISNAKDAIGQTYGTDLGNRTKSAYDYVSSFLSGQGTPQGSISPMANVIPQTPLGPTDNSNALQSALYTYRQNQQPQQPNDSGIDLSSVLMGP